MTATENYGVEHVGLNYVCVRLPMDQSVFLQGIFNLHAENLTLSPDNVFYSERTKLRIDISRLAEQTPDLITANLALSKERSYF